MTTLNKQNIIKLATAKFQVSTEQVRNSELILDFSPLIERFNLSGNYQLIHFQAKPKGHRRWGIYRSRDDSYSSCCGVQVAGTVKTLLIPDNLAQTIPNAVLYIDGNL